jgi:hypothetical protein
MCIRPKVTSQLIRESICLVPDDLLTDCLEIIDVQRLTGADGLRKSREQRFFLGPPSCSHAKPTRCGRGGPERYAKRHVLCRLAITTCWDVLSEVDHYFICSDTKRAPG